MTWSAIGGSAGRTSFSSDGKSVFDGFRTSIDSGANWIYLPEYPINDIRDVVLSGISNDGKKLFATFDGTPTVLVFVSSDGGKTWQKWGDERVFLSHPFLCLLMVLEYSQHHNLQIQIISPSIA